MRETIAPVQFVQSISNEIEFDCNDSQAQALLPKNKMSCKTMYCGRKLASEVNHKYDKVFGYPCNHVACPYCGPHAARRFVRRNLWKGHLIKTRPLNFLLIGPELQINKSSIRDCAYFFETVACLEQHICEDGFGTGVLGHVLYSEFAAPGPKSFRPHAHGGVLVPYVSWKNTFDQISAWWKRNTGLPALPYQGDNETLDGLIGYCEKGPFSSFRPWQQKWLHRTVLEPLEAELGRPASFYKIGGPALSAFGSKQLLARARYEAVKAQMSMKDSFLNDDKAAIGYLLSLEVEYLTLCKKCHAFKDKVICRVNDQLQPELVCQICGNVQADEPILQYRRTAISKRQLTCKIRRLDRAGMRPDAIAERLDEPLQRVQATIQDAIITSESKSYNDH